MVPVASQYSSGGLMGPATPQGYNAAVMPINGNQPMFQNQPITANSTVTTAGLPYQQSQAVPQTGLIGSEQALMGGQYGNEMALQGGLAQSTNTINQGVNQGANTLYGGVNQSNQMLNQGLMGSTGSILSGASGAVNAMGQGYQGATSALGGIQPNVTAVNNNFSANTNVGANITDPLNQGATNFDGFLSGGQNAAKLQADLTGANGQAAQQAAYAQYQSSPAMQYQMDQMQKATERSAASRGGLMSGAVLQELQRNASGIASQDYQNQFNNISQVAGQGLNAAGQIANLKATQAGIAGNLQQSGIAADAQASLANQDAAMKTQMFNQEQKANIASKLADLSSMYGINTGNLLSSTGNLLGQNQLGVAQAQAGNILGASGNVAQAQMGAAQDIAGNQLGTAQNIGQSRYTTGQNLAQGRTNAGMAMAQNATQAASSISQLLNQQGIGVSDMMSKDISGITDMIYNSGMQDKVDMQNLAALIANINGGQASNVTQGNQAIGAAQAAGQLGIGNAANNAINQGVATGLIGGK